MTEPPLDRDLVPDSERIGLIGALPAPLRPYASLIRLDRPIGAWLLFWPCAWGVALAGIDARGWVLIAWLALGAFAMRSAGCVWNDIVDRDLDARVERTRLRPLASGRIGLGGAWILILMLGLVGLLVLVQLRPGAAIVALASLLLVPFYPYMKRLIGWPQLWLGLVFSLGALVGWAAMRPNPLEDWPTPLLLWLGTVAWVVGYDTIYALQDMEDDALAGIRSSALSLGPHSRAGIALCYGAALLLWSAAIWRLRPDLLGLAALLPMALHLAWQAAALKPDDPSDALAKFRSNRMAGLLMFLACLVVGAT